MKGKVIKMKNETTKKFQNLKGACRYHGRNGRVCYMRIFLHTY